MVIRFGTIGLSLGISASKLGWNRSSRLLSRWIVTWTLWCGSQGIWCDDCAGTLLQVRALWIASSKSRQECRHGWMQDWINGHYFHFRFYHSIGTYFIIYVSKLWVNACQFLQLFHKLLRRTWLFIKVLWNVKQGKFETNPALTILHICAITPKRVLFISSHNSSSIANWIPGDADYVSPIDMVVALHYAPLRRCDTNEWIQRSSSWCDNHLWHADRQHVLCHVPM